MKGMGADVFFNEPPQVQEEPVKQHTSIPASQHTRGHDKALVKATFYLTEDAVMILERVRLARRKKGQRIDKSSLVREAITLLSEK